jgi:hypothetical protein
VLAALLVTWPVPASGQPGDPAAAEALFRKAREAKAQGDDAAACALFSESQRLDPSVGTLMNVAECEERTGHLAAAWEHWHESMDQLLRAGDNRAGLARARVEGLDHRVPKLIVRLPPGAEAAHVMRDGVELGPASLGVALPVDPGPHEITVTLKDHEPARRSVVVAEGQSLELLLELGALSTPGRSVGPSRTESPPGRPLHDTRRLWEVVAFGGAGAGLVVTVASALVAAHEKSVVDANCSSDKVCSATGIDAARTGKSWVEINTASSIFTVVGAAAGLALVLTSPAGTTAVAPAGGPGQGGVQITQVF